jgi:hypothetical protein
MSEVELIDKLFQLVEELEARSISANSIFEELHGVSWINVCDRGIKLFEELKKDETN